MIFLCENNGWAISLPVSKQTASETMAQKAIAYGFGLQSAVDGLAADAEQAGDLGDGHAAVRVQLAGVADLAGGELGLAAAGLAAGPGGGQALESAFHDELALELVQGAEEVEGVERLWGARAGWGRRAVPE